MEFLVDTEVQSLKLKVNALSIRTEGELAQKLLVTIKSQIEFLDASGKISDEALALFSEFIQEISQAAKPLQSPPAKKSYIRTIQSDMKALLQEADRPQARKFLQTAINHLELLGESGKISEEMVSLFFQYRDKIETGLFGPPEKLKMSWLNQKKCKIFSGLLVKR